MKRIKTRIFVGVYDRKLRSSYKRLVREWEYVRESFYYLMGYYRNRYQPNATFMPFSLIIGANPPSASDAVKPVIERTHWRMRGKYDRISDAKNLPYTYK